MCNISNVDHDSNDKKKFSIHNVVMTDNKVMLHLKYIHNNQQNIVMKGN